MVNLKVLLSSSVIAMALAQPAVAQDAPADPGAAPAEAAQSQRDSNEIIVTGTRIATNVQDVPIAITAVTSETLEERQITTFANLGAIVPNATFRKSQGIYGASGVGGGVKGVLPLGGPSAFVVLGRGTIYRTDDAGATWEAVGRAPEIAQVVHLKAAAVGPDGGL